MNIIAVDGENSEHINERRGFIRRAMAVAAVPALSASAFAGQEKDFQSEKTSPQLLAGLTDYFFNVKDYGATGNGTTDDTASIQSAINAAIAVGGGRVLLPAGKYLVGGTLSLDAANTTTPVVLQGVTPGPVQTGAAYQGGTSIIVPSTFNGNTILVSFSDSVSVRSLTITSTAPRTGGRAIYLNGATNVVIEDVNMNNQFICMEIWGGYCHRINRGFWQIAANGYGVWVNGKATGNNGLDNSNDTYISGIFTSGGWAAFRIQHTGGVWIRDCDSISATFGLLMDPNADQGIFSCFIASCAFDSSTTSNIQISPLNGGVVKDVDFVQCWSAAVTGSGGNCCVIAGDVRGIKFTSHRFYNSLSGNGLWVNGAKNIFLDGCVAAGIPNGSGYLFVNTTNFAVRNSHSGAFSTFASNGGGIHIAGGCSNYVVIGCTFIGNTTAITDSSPGPKVFPAGMNLVA